MAGAPPQTSLGELTTLSRPPNRENFTTSAPLFVHLQQLPSPLKKIPSGTLDVMDEIEANELILEFVINKDHHDAIFCVKSKFD